MLNNKDKRLIAKKGISENHIEQQLKDFRTGFPFLKIDAPASIENGGVKKPSQSEQEHYIKAWEKYIAGGKEIVKFVPASGAASRMFKDMFSFLDAKYDNPETEFEKTFFTNIHQFAFFEVLNTIADIDKLLQNGQYKDICANMLEKEGLNYGNLPKGMLLFHSYTDGARTPMEEHLVEGALYANSGKKVKIHFTVSAEHLDYFMNKVEEKLPYFEQKYGVKYDITFSEQKPSTDTIAATSNNEPFRDEQGNLVFRPGGHGALIENLNDIDADIIFIKNIDNVVPDRLKGETVKYKKLLAGMLVSLQQKSFEYLKALDSGADEMKIKEIAEFLEKQLCCHPAKRQKIDADYLKHKLNRPMRICGMVKNVGEPGGGPFLAYNRDGSISLQILESNQIDKSNAEYMRMFKEGTHFNPVDLVCAVKNYKGEHFTLPDYVDKSTGFISSKSKNGKELKALELPGLWNGAMSDWNTIFVEVPLITFNPVKTVNDLLRKEHQ